MVRKALTVFAMVMAAGLAAPAGAQDASAQTPENAQAFISKIVDLGGVSIEGAEPGGYWSQGTTYSNRYNFTPGSLLSFKQDDDVCTSAFSLYAPYGQRIQTSWGWDEVVNPIFHAIVYPNPIPNYDRWSSTELKGFILWREVTSVAADGANVVLVKRDKRDLRLTVADANLAKRVAFAMEVIRMACDPTADGAF